MKTVISYSAFFAILDERSRLGLGCQELQFSNEMPRLEEEADHETGLHIFSRESFDLKINGIGKAVGWSWWRRLFLYLSFPTWHS